MIRNIKHIIASLLIFACIASCSSDFLDIDPEQNVAAENVVTDVNTLQTALNGVYSKLQNSDYYGRSMYVIPELMADNLALSIRNTGRYIDYDGFVVNEEDSYANDLWNALYEVVVNATRAIEGGEKLEARSADQQAQIDQLVGEAYALRALAHFDLVRLFAQPYNFTTDAGHEGIPVINHSSENEVSPARNTVKEVYIQVNEDISAAISRISEDKKDGRFSSYAVKALAARVYLYQEDYANAIAYSSEVIDSGEFSLVGNAGYTDLWAEEYNSESIFEIVNTIADNAGTNGLGHFFDPEGYADALATEELFALYESNDIRLSAITEGSKTGAEDEALFVYKFPKGTIHDDNIRIFRLAEQYLIRAEAYARTGKDAQAQADLLAVTDRATPGAAPAGESGQALVDRILLERRKELAFEGHRLFDLNRNKKDVRMIQSDHVIEATYPNDKFILPIPLNELNANPNITQNPGY
ncbi:RagB/SusD family nutrient uptake outer membrane protein [Sinomicrobium weinanense]|uniref:RagB/SusD family nutrient uptake outer membrane protein n=1 Tax=Sinomicrobium weinanense TaxID=2842200 RepID=A0A926Q1Z4_9FLAO|nr:RagB/SusD family nutrient uptake outer membrane protein [Sinomicrobium weinanense]MBC9796147.1 RagB/SusD family nutrient uptake outer membrane protein [Sinomicrobium weinanense]MBU3121898.1 RagB/SusD family nutrient uptake outer membrane protein [Sinomicrobium weinanense]